MYPNKQPYKNTFSFLTPCKNGRAYPMDKLVRFSYFIFSYQGFNPSDNNRYVSSKSPVYHGSGTSFP